MIKMIQKAIAPLKRRVVLMVARSVLNVIDDSKKTQSVEIDLLEDDIRQDVESFAHYGFTSVPASGAEGVAVCVGGNRDHPIVVATEDKRYRPKDLSEGEVALYTKDHGKRVYAKDDGEVHLGTDPTDFVALASLVLSELQTLRDYVKDHTHPAIPSGGGPVLKPASPPAAVGDVTATEVKAK